MVMRGLDETFTEKEKLEIAIEHIHTKNIKNDPAAVKDQDYARNDLEDAGTEELEDKIIEKSRDLQRPLTYDEVTRLSQHADVN